jgi:hypothetical protein
MAAGAQRQYTATFAIGAKMLGSFRGVMAQAQSRIRTMERTAMKAASSVWGFVKKLGGLLSIFAAYAGARVLSSIFSDAGQEAMEADQRARRLSITLLQHEQIRKRGLAYARHQSELIFAQNEALAKQGVLASEVLDATATQMAVYGYAPKRIAAMMGPMSEVLVASKGVAATEEDGAALADAWGRAVKSGMTKGMRQFGFILSDTQQKEFKGLKNAEARNKWILKWAQGYKGVNAEAAKTDVGKIQLFHNQIKAFAKDIGKEVLPAQAAMAGAWSSILPEIKPIAIALFKGILTGARAAAGYFHTTLLPAFKQFMVFVKGPLAAAWAPVVKAFREMIAQVGPAFLNMFTSMGLKGKSFSAMLGDTLIKSLNLLAQTFKYIGDNASWLVPLVSKLAVGFAAVAIAIDVLMPVMAAFNAVMLIGPWGWIAIAIGAVIAGIILLYRHWGTLNNMVEAFWTWLQKIPGLGPILSAFADDLANRWNELKQVWQGLVDAFTAAWPVIKTAAVEIGQAIYDSLMSPIRQVQDAWSGLVEAFKNRPTWLGGAGGAGAAATAPAVTIPGMQTGGIIRGHSLLQVAERGPEAIIPMDGSPRAQGLLQYASRAMGMGGITNNRESHVTFAPQVTINGNAGPAEQRAMDTSLRKLAKDFIVQFKAAQHQERRLSYESGYS